VLPMGLSSASGISSASFGSAAGLRSESGDGVGSSVSISVVSLTVVPWIAWVASSWGSVGVGVGAGGGFGWSL
jgi:hypothetical protein